jgi:lysophospholipase L1-like esterase
MTLARRAILISGGLLVGLAAGEVALRLLYQQPATPGLAYYLDAEGRPIGLEEADRRGMLIPVEPQAARQLRTFAPGTQFYICYGGYPQPWFDERGCVEVQYSSFGIREREEIGFDKPDGQRRVLCIGDSFTFGWGIREEDGWVRLLETELRNTDPNVVTVNCGGAGATLLDEYWWGLRDRFHRFQPDEVVVALCLNDLFISNGSVAHLREKPDSGFLLLDQALYMLQGADPLRLDPSVDYVDMLVNLPADHPLYQTGGRPEFYWASGTPQKALQDMSGWCQERGIPFSVILWPFLQGLGTDHYPFEGMHERVAEFCRAEGLHFLDLLPVLRDVPARELWVTPSDLHVNPRGHRLAAGPIARFLEDKSP